MHLTIRFARVRRSAPAAGSAPVLRNILSRTARLLVPLAVAVVAGLTSPAAYGQSPTVQLLNLSRPGSSGFYVGDSFRVVVTGPPFQEVMITGGSHDGEILGPSSYGYTNDDGLLTLDSFFPEWALGTWTEVWAVGGVQAEPILFFEVQPQPPACGVSITPNPLTLISVDFYDYYDPERYLYTERGMGIINALSPFPHCVQTYSDWGADPHSPSSAVSSSRG
jgi:hypothetical protein